MNIVCDRLVISGKQAQGENAAQKEDAIANVLSTPGALVRMI